MGKHAKIKRWEKYSDDGTVDAEKCPRCGSFLAAHEDRKSCGKCGYTKHE